MQNDLWSILWMIKYFDSKDKNIINLKLGWCADDGSLREKLRAQEVKCSLSRRETRGWWELTARQRETWLTFFFLSVRLTSSWLNQHPTREQSRNLSCPEPTDVLNSSAHTNHHNVTVNMSPSHRPHALRLNIQSQPSFRAHLHKNQTNMGPSHRQRPAAVCV